MHLHSHPNFFIISFYYFQFGFYKKGFEIFSLLRKLQISTLRIVLRAIE